MAYLLHALLALVGVAAIIFGGYDDSPGLQGIGLIMVIIAVVLVVRRVRRKPS